MTSPSHRASFYHHTACLLIAPKTARFIDRIRGTLSIAEAVSRLKPRHDAPRPFRIVPRTTMHTIARLWDRLIGAGVAASSRRELADEATIAAAEHYNSNIESMIGTVKVPVGIIGPLRVNGIHAHGDFLVPLATTEAALVASHCRGAAATNRAGGITVATLADGVVRTPAFRFASIADAGRFVDWVEANQDPLSAAANATTRYGALVSIDPTIDGEVVFLMCTYFTGDAAGQNMVTFATDALCRAAVAQCPVKPLSWFLEGNYSGDKKASFLGVMHGRGRAVTAQVDLAAAIIEQVLGCSVERILEYGRIAHLGALLSGQIGAQAHYANGLAGLYLATGQDVACVAESAVGFTRMEASAIGLKVTVKLPNLLVGTVGGGTGLPSQAAALDVMGLRGTGHAHALAEIAAALCLCGEISLTAAVAAGQFGSAHRRLARGRA
jgi:hydroxymethylglutaryl-CoA reductase (NADPH)